MEQLGLTLRLVAQCAFLRVLPADLPLALALSGPKVSLNHMLIRNVVCYSVPSVGLHHLQGSLCAGQIFIGLVTCMLCLIDEPLTRVESLLCQGKVVCFWLLVVICELLLGFLGRSRRTAVSVSHQLTCLPIELYLCWRQGRRRLCSSYLTTVYSTIERRSHLLRILAFTSLNNTIAVCGLLMDDLGFIIPSI